MTDLTQSCVPRPGPEQVEHPGLTRDLQVQPDHAEDSYTGSGRLTGRRALITGGDSGIDRAVALAFARQGADVTVVHLPDEQDDAAETVRLVEQAGRTALALPGNLTDEGFARGCVHQAVDGLGGLDLLVHNAAYQMTQDGVAGISTEQLDRCSAPTCTRCSGSCRRRCRTCSPGRASSQPAPCRPGETPLGRAGQPVEVARAFVFLGSDEASHVTGARLTVAGGMPMP